MARLGHDVSVAVQTAIALAIVLGAIAYLVRKLVWKPATRSKGPDVPLRSIVRKARAKKAEHEHGCH